MSINGLVGQGTPQQVEEYVGVTQLPSNAFRDGYRPVVCRIVCWNLFLKLVLATRWGRDDVSNNPLVIASYLGTDTRAIHRPDVS